MQGGRAKSPPELSLRLEGDVREPQVASADKKEAESDDPSRTLKLALASHAESVV